MKPQLLEQAAPEAILEATGRAEQNAALNPALASVSDPVPARVRGVAGPVIPDRMDPGQFTIHPCRSIGELEQCIALQQETWGYPDREVVPRNVFVLAQALGGHVLCAWDSEGELAGFAMTMAAHQPVAGPAIAANSTWMCTPSERSIVPVSEIDARAKPAPVPYLHSHMVAVRPRYQNRGLGFALKLRQRQDALSRGITRMRWTFDPMAARNAYFNLRRIGTTASRYLPDFYGKLESTLQGGLPSDRLLVDWELEPELAKGRGAAEREAADAEEIVLSGEIPRWRAEGAMAELEAEQRSLREQFQSAFRRGLILCDFAPGPEGGGTYRLEQPFGS